MLSMFQPKDNKAKYEQTIVEVESEELVKKDKKSKTPVNEYDVCFNWDRNDPWLGVDVESGYVPMSVPTKKGKHNEAFYFMYKSKNTQNPRVLVHLIGGPGCCVMQKCLNRYNPLRLNEERRCLERNPDDITGDYHLLFIECPVGCGFSIANKETYVKDYDTLGLNAVETFRHIFAKNPCLAHADFFFHGESFCGLSVPIVIETLRSHLHISFKGVILECHVMNLMEQQGGKYQLQKLKEYEMWDNCCHKCCCTTMFKCGMCCYANKCLGFGTMEGIYFLPWLFCCNSWFYNKKAINPYDIEKKEKDTDFAKFSFSNISKESADKGPTRVENVPGNRAIELLIMTKQFAKMIGAKKTITAGNAPAQIDIIDNDLKYQSNDIQSGWVKEGISFLVTSGEGDYIVPWKSQYDQMKKHWEFPGKQKFLDMGWTKTERPGDATFYVGKKLGNFEWRRINGGGHLLYDDFPKYNSDYMTEFMDSHYHTRPAEHHHHHALAQHVHNVGTRPAEIHHSSLQHVPQIGMQHASYTHHSGSNPIVQHQSPRMMHSDTNNARTQQYSYQPNANTRSQQYNPLR